MVNFIDGVWHPVINDEKCKNCGICFNFCPRSVFIQKDDQVIVNEPEKCVENCHGCEWRCPYGAITFPEPFTKDYAFKVINYYSKNNKEIPERLIKFLKEKSIIADEEIESRTN